MASAWLNAESTSSVRQPDRARPGAGQPDMAGLELRQLRGQPGDALLQGSWRAALADDSETCRKPIDRRDERGDTSFAKRGWTTGACAAAAAKAACAALLPANSRPGRDRAAGRQARRLRARRMGTRRRLCACRRRQGCRRRPRRDAWRAAARHGAARRGRRRRDVQGAARASALVTRPGLPIPPGEPAINPVPRKMIAEAIAEAAGRSADFEVEISVPDGEKMALKTLNGAPRHSGRHLDPRHDGRRHPLFLLGLDPFDPSRHRRGARRGARPCRRRHRARPPRPRCRNCTTCRRSR